MQFNIDHTLKLNQTRLRKLHNQSEQPFADSSFPNSPPSLKDKKAVRFSDHVVTTF